MSAFNGHHVTHLLAAYVEGQLSPRQVAQVQRHLAICAACCQQLAAHEWLAADLRLMIGQHPSPSPAKVQTWWQAISARPYKPLRRYAFSMLLPALLSLLLLMLPIIANINASGGLIPDAQSTAALPVVDGVLEPPSTVMQAASLVPATRAITVTAIATAAVEAPPLPSAELPPTPAAP